MSPDDPFAPTPVGEPVTIHEDPQLEEIMEMIEKVENPRRSVGKNLLYLGLSLILFFLLGLFENTVTDIIILVVVLLFHEAGHYVAMTAFGYRDVKMFFIPLVGAAVSGRPQRVSST